jgi:hypothetical protein
VGGTPGPAIERRQDHRPSLSYPPPGCRGEGRVGGAPGPATEKCEDQPAGETWTGIHEALVHGRRNLPGGSLARFPAQHQ